MNTLTLTVCGFYVKHGNLQEIKNLSAEICLRYNDLTKELTHCLDNMSGEITLTKGSKEAIMTRAGKRFNFDILYVSGLSLAGQTETYPEIQFGTEHLCEFRLIVKPNITREEIEKFIGIN